MNNPPDSSIEPRGDDGGAGARAPLRQMELSRGVRQRRLERMVARAKLKLAVKTARHAGPDADRCLDTLRDGLGAGITREKTVVSEDGASVESTTIPDTRERRLSAEAILRHHREVVKLGGDGEHPAPTGPTELHLHLHPPGDVEAERATLAGIAAAFAEAEAVCPPMPASTEETNGHDGSGHEQNGHGQNGSA